MQRFQLADQNIKVLDQKEKEHLTNIVRAEFQKRVSMAKSIQFTTPQGIVDGANVYQMAQVFENKIKQFPLEKIFPMCNMYVEMIDQVSEVDPDYYDFSYVNAKNIMAASEIVEKYTTENREELHKDKPKETCLELKNCVYEKFVSSKEYLTKALMLFAQYRSSQDDHTLSGLETQMMSKMASLPRRKAFFMVQSEPELKMYQSIDKVLSLSGQSMNAYSNLFENSVFLDEIEAAKILCNYANALKLSLSPEGFKQGLRYYEEARKYVGESRVIDDGITFFKDVLRKRVENKQEYLAMFYSMN